MAKDFNDLASLTTKTGWRRRGIGAAVLVAALCIGGFFLWDTQLKSEGSSAPKTATQAVARGTIRQTVATSGTVAAESSTSLSFQTTGRVTSVNVKLGQQVKQGDVLAEVDTTDLKSALATSQANLHTAQIKLRQLQKPATAADLASADQAVAQAQAAYDKANNDLSTLTGPPTASDLAAAQQAVSAAPSQLQQAQNSLD
jgi:multidrug efflux pump subunit AcrA (membrane-fusion protein)